MIFEIIDVEVPAGMPSAKVVVVTYEDGSGESFPVDENNPRYIQFKEQLAAEQNYEGTV